MASYYLIEYGLIIVSVLIVSVAQIVLRSKYAKYKKINVESGMTGREVAERILRENGINDVNITKISGELTDNYNNSKKLVSLSDDIYDGRSIASVSVAAHECGHAIQYKTGYVPIKIRNTLVPFVNFGNTIGYIVIIVSLIFSLANLFLVGIILMSLAVVFHLITLPCELNASKRAKKELLRLGLITEKEHDGSSSVLRAAAFTYVAGLITSLLEVLRLVLLFSDRNRD
ncbi:MAG: zinc metallopeptidase [Bacilli bacterium]|nr:zinc metallopeptidase [Bacilli bacterium]